jgi:hypothetical protein
VGGFSSRGSPAGCCTGMHLQNEPVAFARSRKWTVPAQGSDPTSHMIRRAFPGPAVDANATPTTEGFDVTDVRQEG